MLENVISLTNGKRLDQNTGVWGTGGRRCVEKTKQRLMVRARTGNNEFETEDLEGNENKRVGSYLKGGGIKENKMSKLLFSGKREWEANLGVMTEVGTVEKGRMEVGKIQELGR